MIGILTEKPSAGRNFAKALGGSKGNYNGEDYVIVSARGHLYEFVNPDEMCGNDEALKTRFKKWNLENMPWDETKLNWKYGKKKDTSSTLKEIQNVLGSCAEIVIATDVDPSGEGELLACEILLELKLSPKKLSRMYFTDESAKEIQKAFTGRKVIPSIQQDMDYVKALYRSKWDFLSMQWTRIATTCGDGQSVVREGRLKSAMVLMVGDQLKAVANYKKVPFYSNRFKDENGNVYTNPNEPTFKTKAEVPQTYQSSPVVLDKTEHKTTAPKKLIDLATLSAMLSSKGIKAKAVLDTYQKMYEAQVVSYPRTEDKVITPEQFNELLPLVDKIAGLVGVDTSLLTHRTPRSTHVKTGGTHGANRPGPKPPNSLSDLAKYGACAADIYTILAKSYLAMLAEDYEYDVEYGHLEKYPDFKGSVSIPAKAGWKAVFSDIDDDNDGDGKHLGKYADPFIHEGFPPKPTAPTMKWLMSQLEKAEIGTGATRTSTYADVTNEKTKYPLMIEKKGKLSLAECGEISYKLLPGTHIGSLEITKEVTNDMKLIFEGKANPEECLARIQGYIKEDIEIMRKNGADIQKKGGSGMDVERVKGVWAKTGEEISFKRVYCQHRFTDAEVADLLAGKTIEAYDFVSSKTGNTFGCEGHLEEQEYQGKKYIGFKSLGFKNEPGKIPDAWAGHKFTKDEKAMLESGSKVKIDGLVSKKTGKTYSATMSWNKSENKIDMSFD